MLGIGYGAPPSPTRGRREKESPGSRPGRRGIGIALANSIQRERLRVPSTKVRRRIEWLAVDRAVLVFAPERWIAELRRKRVVGEFAVTRQDFGAGIEPGALGDIDPGMRPLLIGHVRSVRSVIGPTAVVVSTRRLGTGGNIEAGRDHGSCRQQQRELARDREFPNQ